MGKEEQDMFEGEGEDAALDRPLSASEREEKNISKALEDQRAKAASVVAGFGTELRTLVDSMSLSNNDKKKFVDLINRMYKFGEGATGL